MAKITIPHNYKPRHYQLPLLRAIDSGIKRAFLFIHRRAGKDKTCVNIAMKRAYEVVGLHYYFFPTYTQGKKIVWDNLDMMQHFPEELIKSRNSVEMKITLNNGSVIQFIGTDNADTVRGTNPVTCIFSEYAFHNPVVWDIIRPILNENGGIAIFQTTPNGDNHASELYELAKDNEKWFTQVLTIDETKRDDGTPVITQEDIAEERKMGMSEEMIQQEYYCNRKIGKVGAFWADQIVDAYNQERIGKLPILKNKVVDVYSDLGMSDDTSMWFTQEVGQSFHFLKDVSENGKEISYYFKLIDDYLLENGLSLGILHLPHDGRKRELTSGVTVQHLAIEHFGNTHVRVVPITGKQTQINTARSILPYCSFDDIGCKDGIKALKNYHREWDDRKKVFKQNPMHDWCLVAGTKILMDDGEKNIEDVKVGDSVLIDDLKGLVTKAGYVRESRTIEVFLSNGAKIKCSPEHKIFTSRGLVCADDLVYNDCVHTNSSNLCDITKFRSIGIKKGFMQYIKEQGLIYGKKESCIALRKVGNKNFYTGLFGRIITKSLYLNLRLFQLMETGMTLVLETGLPEKKEQKGTSKASMNIKNLKARNTTKQKKGISITNTYVNIYIDKFGSIIMEKYQRMSASITKIIIKVITKLATFVRWGSRNTQNYTLKLISGLVARRIKDKYYNNKNELQKCVVERVLRSSKKISVYDLTIEKHHCYYANGVLVSNSSHASDAFQNFAMAQKNKIKKQTEKKKTEVIVEDYGSSNPFSRF